MANMTFQGFCLMFGAVAVQLSIAFTHTCHGAAAPADVPTENRRESDERRDLESLNQKISPEYWKAIEAALKKFESVDRELCGPVEELDKRIRRLARHKKIREIYSKLNEELSDSKFKTLYKDNTAALKEYRRGDSGSSEMVGRQLQDTSQQWISLDREFNRVVGYIQKSYVWELLQSFPDLTAGLWPTDLKYRESFPTTISVGPYPARNRWKTVELLRSYPADQPTDLHHGVAFATLEQMMRQLETDLGDCRFWQRHPAAPLVKALLWVKKSTRQPSASLAQVAANMPWNLSAGPNPRDRIDDDGAEVDCQVFTLDGKLNPPALRIFQLNFLILNREQLRREFMRVNPHCDTDVWQAFYYKQLGNIIHLGQTEFAKKYGGAYFTPWIVDDWLEIKHFGEAKYMRRMPLVLPVSLDPQVPGLVPALRKAFHKILANSFKDEFRTEPFYDGSTTDYQTITTMQDLDRMEVGFYGAQAQRFNAVDLSPSDEDLGSMYWSEFGRYIVFRPDPNGRKQRLLGLEDVDEGETPKGILSAPAMKAQIREFAESFGLKVREPQHRGRRTGEMEISELGGALLLKLNIRDLFDPEKLEVKGMDRMVDARREFQAFIHPEVMELYRDRYQEQIAAIDEGGDEVAEPEWSWSSVPTPYGEILRWKENRPDVHQLIACAHQVVVDREKRREARKDELYQAIEGGLNFHAVDSRSWQHWPPGMKDIASKQANIMSDLQSYGGQIIVYCPEINKLNLKRRSSGVVLVEYATPYENKDKFGKLITDAIAAFQGKFLQVALAKKKGTLPRICIHVGRLEFEAGVVRARKVSSTEADIDSICDHARSMFQSSDVKTVFD